MLVFIFHYLFSVTLPRALPEELSTHHRRKKIEFVGLHKTELHMQQKQQNKQCKVKKAEVEELC